VRDSQDTVCVRARHRMHGACGSGSATRCHDSETVSGFKTPQTPMVMGGVFAAATTTTTTTWVVVVD
jgi:hypothetical protein